MTRAKNAQVRAAATPPRGSVWVVTDPTVHSTLVDICAPTSADSFILQVRAGFSETEHPTFHGTKRDAEADAVARIVGLRVREAIVAAASTVDLRDAARLEIRARDGRLLLGADLGGTP